MPSVGELNKLRSKFLQTLYEEVGGSSNKHVYADDVGKKAKTPPNAVDTIVEYLVGEGYVQYAAMGGKILITHGGVKEIERRIGIQASVSIPQDSPAAKSPPNPIAHSEHPESEEGGPANDREIENNLNAGINLKIRPIASHDSCGGIDDDTLGRRPYVDALADFFSLSQLSGPFTLAVTGEWGEGKTVFLKWLADELEKRGYSVVWFNAWKHETKHTVWASLAISIIEQRRRKNRFLYARLWWENFQEEVGAIELFLSLSLLASLVTITIYGLPYSINPYILAFPGLIFVWPLLVSMWKVFRGSLSQRLRNIKNLNLESELGFQYKFEREFKKILKITSGGDRPLIIFVDDLDRLSPSKGAEVFEAIHFLGDNENCVFVVGLDIKAISNSLTERYGGKDGAGYSFIEKFVQLFFSLPVATQDQIESYARSLLKPSGRSAIQEKAAFEALTIKVSPDVGEKEKHIEDDFDTSKQVDHILQQALKWMPSNPRQVKRFVNNFRLMAFLARRLSLLNTGEVNLYHLGALLVARQRYPDLLALLSQQNSGRILNTLACLINNISIADGDKPLVDMYDLNAYVREKQTIKSLLPALVAINKNYRKVLEIVH